MKLVVKRIELDESGILKAVDFDPSYAVSPDEIAQYVQELRRSIAFKVYSEKSNEPV